MQAGVDNFAEEALEVGWVGNLVTFPLGCALGTGVAECGVQAKTLVHDSAASVEFVLSKDLAVRDFSPSRLVLRASKLCNREFLMD